MSTMLYSPKYYYPIHRFAEFRDYVMPHGQVVTFSKDEMIVGPDEPMHSLYYVLEGIMRFYVTGEDLDGSVLEKTIMYAGPDDIFPLYGPVNHVCRFECENQMLIASTDIRAIRFSREICQHLMRENFGFTSIMLNAYADLAGILLYDSLNLLRSGRKRIINFLAMYNSTMKPAKILLTQEEIATITGVTLPTVARVLRELRDDGMIVTNRKEIVIRDKERLLELCSDAAIEDGPDE